MTSVQTHSPDPATWTRGPVADIFSSYVAATALSSAQELGLLDLLAETGAAPFGNGGDERLNDEVVQSVYRALHWAEVVEIKDEETVVTGPAFDAAFAARGYFYWLVRGCGEAFSEAPRLALEEVRSGAFYRRDMRAVAIGSRLIGDGEVEALFDEILTRTPVRKIADLGCGSGQRLVRVAGRHPEARCVGVDISSASVRLAADAAREAGLGERMTVHQGDVLRLEPRPEFADVDTISCVFMGHDFWPYDSCVATLERLRRVFPRAERLLLCDVVRTQEVPRTDTPIFQLGFETIHALMGVYLPALEEWHKAFAEAGWRCDAVHSTTTPPNGHLFELSPTTRN
ncbi:class I SAM-dependent methyltransferase [Streptomyces sp. NPDC001668]|uniref:class I SAM-dependent methyltransferase n=1 Tax=unclassified Streptomyces TaxID=2593676 RepID=UPI0034020C31